MRSTFVRLMSWHDREVGGELRETRRWMTCVHEIVIRRRHLPAAHTQQRRLDSHNGHVIENHGDPADAAQWRTAKNVNTGN